MKPDASLLFRSRGEFEEAVLTALASSRRDLLIGDRDFSDWPIETAAGFDALDAFLSGNTEARLRVLVADPDWLERRGARFARLRRYHASAIACRQIPASLFANDGVIVGDGMHLLRRAHHDFFRGRLSLGRPSDIAPIAQRWDALWEESTPCLSTTTLGL
jgi:hypothetical protein